jgi:hypothetical protein
MNHEFEAYYANLDADSKHVYHVLALCPNSISINDLSQVVNVRLSVHQKIIRKVLSDGRSWRFFDMDYYDSYLLKSFILIWLYPLTVGLTKEKELLEARERNINFRFYGGYTNKSILAYLDALWNNPSQLKTCEENLLNTGKDTYLTAILHQPLYNKVLDRISAKILEKPYRMQASEIVKQLVSLDFFRGIDARFESDKSAGIAIEQAKLLLKGGDWHKAQQLIRTYDCSVLFYTEALKCFTEGDHVKALA